MQLSRSKTSVMAWLLFVLCSLVASLISLSAGVFNLSYALPAMLIGLTLHWLRTDRRYSSQPFYRIAWRVNLMLMLALGLILLCWQLDWPVGLVSG
jgi:hypothetical protein